MPVAPLANVCLIGGRLTEQAKANTLHPYISGGSVFIDSLWMRNVRIPMAGECSGTVIDRATIVSDTGCHRKAIGRSEVCLRTGGSCAEQSMPSRSPKAVLSQASVSGGRTGE